MRSFQSYRPHCRAVNDAIVGLRSSELYALFQIRQAGKLRALARRRTAPRPDERLGTQRVRTRAISEDTKTRAAGLRAASIRRIVATTPRVAGSSLFERPGGSSPNRRGHRRGWPEAAFFRASSRGAITRCSCGCPAGPAKAGHYNAGRLKACTTTVLTVVHRLRAGRRWTAR
jgi:hypothetical protein